MSIAPRAGRSRMSNHGTSPKRFAEVLSGSLGTSINRTRSPTPEETSDFISSLSKITDCLGELETLNMNSLAQYEGLTSGGEPESGRSLMRLKSADTRGHDFRSNLNFSKEKHFVETNLEAEQNVAAMRKNLEGLQAEFQEYMEKFAKEFDSRKTALKNLKRLLSAYERSFPRKKSVGVQCDIGQEDWVGKYQQLERDTDSFRRRLNHIHEVELRYLETEYRRNLLQLTERLNFTVTIYSEDEVVSRDGDRSLYNSEKDRYILRVSGTSEEINSSMAHNIMHAKIDMSETSFSPVPLRTPGVKGGQVFFSKSINLTNASTQRTYTQSASAVSLFQPQAHQVTSYMDPSATLQRWKTKLRHSGGVETDGMTQDQRPMTSANKNQRKKPSPGRQRSSMQTSRSHRAILMSHPSSGMESTATRGFTASSFGSGFSRGLFSSGTNRKKGKKPKIEISTDGGGLFAKGAPKTTSIGVQEKKISNHAFGIVLRVNSSDPFRAFYTDPAQEELSASQRLDWSVIEKIQQEHPEICDRQINVHDVFIRLKDNYNAKYVDGKEGVHVDQYDYVREKRLLIETLARQSQFLRDTFISYNIEHLKQLYDAVEMHFETFLVFLDECKLMSKKFRRVHALNIAYISTRAGKKEPSHFHMLTEEEKVEWYEKVMGKDSDGSYKLRLSNFIECLIRLVHLHPYYTDYDEDLSLKLKKMIKFDIKPNSRFLPAIFYREIIYKSELGPVLRHYDRHVQKLYENVRSSSGGDLSRRRLVDINTFAAFLTSCKMIDHKNTDKLGIEAALNDPSTILASVRDREKYATNREKRQPLRGDKKENLTLYEGSAAKFLETEDKTVDFKLSYLEVLEFFMICLDSNRMFLLKAHARDTDLSISYSEFYHILIIMGIYACKYVKRFEDKTMEVSVDIFLNSILRQQGHVVSYAITSNERERRINDNQKILGSIFKQILTLSVNGELNHAIADAREKDTMQNVGKKDQQQRGKRILMEFLRREVTTPEPEKI